MEKELGVRYTPLLDLEYYHHIKFCAIDAMHNLFLGTAKTFMRLLLKNKDTKKELLTDDKMATIDKRLTEFKQGLTDVWVVENMKSNMGSLTAAEWRHWTVVSSAYCLHGQSAAVTPNMHMQMHLTSVVREYGPWYTSWLFAFGQYNGALGDINTNNRQIEGQIMSRFMEAGLVDSLQDQVPMQYESHFAPLLKSMKRMNLSVAETMQVPEALIVDCEDHWSNCTGMVTLLKTSVTGLHSDELQLLRQTYKAMYPSQAAVFDDKYTFEYGPNHYASATKGVRTLKNGWIMASWFGAKKKDRNPEPKPGFIHYFLKHSVVDQENGATLRHYFAWVTWYKPWPIPTCYIHPLTQWKKTDFELESWASYLPVSRIKSRFGCVTKVDQIVVALLANKLYV